MSHPGSSHIEQDMTWLLTYDFWEIANNVLHKDKSAIHVLFNGPKVLSSVFDKTKLLTTFPRTLIVMSQVSLFVIFLPEKLKLHNIPVTPKLVRQVITNLDRSKEPFPDYIPVVVLKNLRLDFHTYLLNSLICVWRIFVL